MRRLLVNLCELLSFVLAQCFVTSCLMYIILVFWWMSEYVYLCNRRVSSFTKVQLYISLGFVTIAFIRRLLRSQKRGRSE